MADNIEQKIKSYRTAPFDARFPNTNQTRNCYQNYLGEFVRTVSSRNLLLCSLICLFIRVAIESTNTLNLGATELFPFFNYQSFVKVLGRPGHLSVEGLN